MKIAVRAGLLLAFAGALTALAQRPMPPKVPPPPTLTADQQAALDDLAPAYAADVELRPGWFRNHPVLYYDFGPIAQPTAVGRVVWPIYGFDAQGNPVAMRNQRPIFSTLPGAPGYSGLWRLDYLVVADHAQPNELRDLASVDAMAARHRAILRPTNLTLNLPVVARGSRLLRDSTPPLLGWFRGRDVQYFDFGAASLSPVPLLAFVRGRDANGTPEFLREQNNIVDTIPGAAPFADLWAIRFVHPDSAYVPNSLRDAAQVANTPALRVDPVTAVRNCPVVFLDDKRLVRAPSPLREFADLRSPFPPSPTLP